MKRIVYCTICERDLGRYHNSQSTVPLRNHIYESHPVEYQKLVNLVNQVDDLYETLKTYGINHWNKSYFHNNVKFEIELENAPPMSDEKRKALLEKIMADKE